MKALIVCGSGVRGGYADAMCRGAEDGLFSAGWDTETVYLRDAGISHCTGCGRCSEGGCVIDDGMGEMYRRLSDSGLLLVATPIFFSGPSSLTVAFLDRLNPYWHNGDTGRPRYMAGLMCGGRKRSDFSHAEAIMRTVAKTTGMEWAGSLGVPGADSEGKDVFEKRARDFAAGLPSP